MQHNKNKRVKMWAYTKQTSKKGEFTDQVF